MKGAVTFWSVALWHFSCGFLCACLSPCFQQNRYPQISKAEITLYILTNPNPYSLPDLYEPPTPPPREPLREHSLLVLEQVRLGTDRGSVCEQRPLPASVFTSSQAGLGA